MDETRKFTEADIGLEDTVIGIEKDENGVKVVHIYGYAYYSESSEDDPKPYRFVEYTFFYATLKDVLEQGLREIENTQSEFVKQYIEDCSYEEMLNMYRHYDDGKCPIPIAEEDITEDIKEGVYAVIYDKAVDSCDADRILAEAVESHVSAGGMRDDGPAEYILDIWKNSSDPKSIEKLFEFFTNMEFRKFLGLRTFQIKNVATTKKYVVVEANNLDCDIFVSEPFDTKPEATAYMKNIYSGLVQQNKGNIDEEYDESESLSEDSYSLQLSNDDIYYGHVKEVELPATKKRYFIVHSNNISFGAELSQPFATKPEAVAYMKVHFDQLVRENSGFVKSQSISEDSYRVTLYINECYYGRIEER